MTYAEFKLETAKQIIRNSEEIQESTESEYTKASEQRSAYRQLKELLTEN